LAGRFDPRPLSERAYNRPYHDVQPNVRNTNIGRFFGRA
jgi:hypothetical protein